MIFHFSFEIPVSKKEELNCDIPQITDGEIRIVKDQIRKNSALINDYIQRIDLFVNKEKYPRKEKFLERLRKQLFLLMEENDTFRKVVWKYQQQEAF